MIKTGHRVDGGGSRWVTFVTGIANDLTLWDGQVSALERDFRILRYDLRGHGGSEATDGDYSIGLLVADLRLRDTVKQNGLESIVEPTVQRWFSEDFKTAHPEVLESIRRMIRGTRLQGYLGVTAAFLGLDVEEGLGRITAPTLYVSGAEDKLGGPPELMQGLSEKVKGARHVSVPKAAHIANIQNPAGFNRVLSDFLGRTA